MERSPIKVPSENDETSVKDEAQEVDEDTLQGEVKPRSQLLIFQKGLYFNNALFIQGP